MCANPNLDPAPSAGPATARRRSAPRAPVGKVITTAPTAFHHARAYRVARAQRQVIFALLGGLSIPVIWMSFVFIPGMGRHLGSASIGLCTLVYVVSAVLGLIGTYRLMVEVQGAGIATAIALVVSLFIPVITALLVLVASLQATKWLRAQGYEVGLMGANVPPPPAPKARIRSPRAQPRTDSAR